MLELVGGAPGLAACKTLAISKQTGHAEETAAGNRLEDMNEHPLPGMYNAPPSRFTDAELEEMMRAQGVDPREVEEYRFDVPTEFDLTPEELRQYDPDDEMYNEEAEMERDFNFHVRGLGAPR